jgi:F420H(2)-dependent quinone reductase
MKPVKLLATLLGAYLGLVVAFECLVGFMGHRQASRGLEPGESWLVITTTDADGAARDTVIAGVESGGQLYVAANHWPRAWYDRAVESPDVEIVRGGEATARRAVVVVGEERVRVARDYELPWVLRFLTGFPPRSFLRLDPR